MANVFIVNHTVGGYYVENWTSYFGTRAEAEEEYNDCVASVGDDPVLIALIELNTETLKAETIRSWSGTIDDLEDELDDEDFSGHVGIPDGHDPGQDSN